MFCWVRARARFMLQTAYENLSQRLFAPTVGATLFCHFGNSCTLCYRSTNRRVNTSTVACRRTICSIGIPLHMLKGTIIFHDLPRVIHTARLQPLAHPPPHIRIETKRCLQYTRQLLPTNISLKRKHGGQGVLRKKNNTIVVMMENKNLTSLHQHSVSLTTDANSLWKTHTLCV